MRPTMMDAPGFLTHQIVRYSVAIPSISHRMGRWVMFRKAGLTMEFITAQRDAEIVMVVSSPVLNFSNVFTYYERGRSAERVVLKLTYWKLIGLSDWIELVKVLACNFNM